MSGFSAKEFEPDPTAAPDDDDDGASGLFAVVVDDLPLQPRIDLRVIGFVRGSGFDSLRCDLSLSWWCEEGEQRFGVGSAARQRSGGHQRGKRT